MTEFFWIFSVSAAVILIVFLIAATRHGTLSWAWNLLIVVVVLAFSLFKLTGVPRDAWLFSTIEGVHGEIQVVYHSVVPNKFVYLLLRQNPSQQPYYVRLPWSKQIEQQLKAAAMQATARRAPLMVNADRLSKGELPGSKDQKQGQGQAGQPDKGNQSNHAGMGTEDGERMFYAKPVQGDPDKVPPRSVTIDHSSIPNYNNNQENPDE
jgi:hypothetical protein